MRLQLDILKDFEFTEDGYIISDGVYIGMRSDNKWDWLSNYKMCQSNLKPIINIKAINDIKECRKHYLQNK